MSFISASVAPASQAALASKWACTSCFSTLSLISVTASLRCLTTLAASPALGVAVAAGLVEAIEGVAYLVVGVDLALLVLHLGHVAVDAGDVVLAVNAGAPGLVLGCWALSMGVLERAWVQSAKPISS